ncbi:hypothetical protein [Duganella aquatilis]|uniref:hypothetical protein n=1 Tax=Duganella aquatilis TaxID=2666082 RepID=UPI00140D03AC|nr:hypothetical protein [Duganella aquatilis]
MERAIYSKTGLPISVAQYVRHEGAKLDGKGQRRVRAAVTCPGCSEPVHTISENLFGRANTWGHDPNPLGPWCPIKDSGGIKYALLAPTSLNAMTGKALRASFLTHWQIHWGHIQHMAAFADIDTFIGFIQHADRTNFWDHIGLQEWHLPYIALSFCEHPPRAARTEWFRFMFDSKIRDYADLWIRTTGTWKFLKMRYRNPRTGVPGPTHYIDCDLITPDPLFLTKPFRPPNSHQLRKMKSIYGV